MVLRIALVQKIRRRSSARKTSRVHQTVCPFDKCPPFRRDKFRHGHQWVSVSRASYPKEWIDKRLRGIAVRQDLTDEWKQRGARNSQEFAILTNEIMHGTFALKVDEYKQVKALAHENLRDHMADIELILTMLAEATTTKLHRDRDSKGMTPLKKDAKDGGAVAGRTRKDIEKQTGKPVISPDNFKPLAGKKMTKKLSGG